MGKIINFLQGANFDYDQIIAKLLYAQITEWEHDKESLYLDGEAYSKENLRFIITTYAKRGFIDKEFLPKEPIKEGIKDIISFWKNIIQDKVKKYYKIDIILVLMILGMILYQIMIKLWV